MYIIVILSLIPVIIWSFMQPLGVRFYDLNSTTTSIGQILGLVGMVLFSINLFLAGRFKFLDKFFKGLDKVYTKHGMIGSIAFSMMLFHPLFLAVKYLSVSTQTAAMFFVPFISPSVTWGIISLVLMIVLISFTFYIKLKFHIWKMSHKFMIVAFVFGIIHTFLISSDISRNNLLRYYILSLAVVGLVVSVRKAFLDKFLVKKSKYTVIKINPLNESVREIEMKPQGEKINFNAGQFAFFEFIGESVSSESHPFSISSSTLEDDLKITYKNLGDFTSELKNLKINDEVLIDGPYGNLSFKNTPNKKQVWVAGGIGITPFLSMAKSLEREYVVSLFYAVKESSESVYPNDFNNISLNNPNFKFNLWDSKEKGYLNAEAVSDLSGGLGDKDVFLCGPPMFMESLRNQFVGQGVDIKKIHYENFNY